MTLGSLLVGRSVSGVSCFTGADRALCEEGCRIQAGKGHRDGGAG